MAASVQCRAQERTLGMVMKEVDEDLAIFLQRRRNEKERKHYVCPQNSEELKDLFVEESQADERYLISNETLMKPATQMAMEKFLSSENEERDYEWLLSPPREPSYTSSDTEEQKPIANPMRTKSDSTALKYKSTNSLEDKTSQNMSSVHPSTATSKNASLPNKSPSCAGSGRPSAEVRKLTASRAATPTRQQRDPSTTKPSRASTPSRASLASAKPAAIPARSSTPVRANSRSSTPTARSTVSATLKSASRSATPTHRPSTPSTTSSTSAFSARSSSVPKRAPTMSRNLSSSSVTSQTVTSRHSSSRDDSTKRPSSASRARPSSPLLRPSTTNNATDEISRCKSHSSSRSQTPTIAAHGSGSTSLSRSRGHSINKDDVNPVVMGTKMVERVVSMRKLAPAKPDCHLSNKDSSKKSSYSQESSGFGTSFSKKALDMALRHMDIKRSTPGNLRAVSTGAPPAPVNGVCTGSSKSEPAGSVSEHLLAMSSGASPDPNIENSQL